MASGWLGLEWGDVPAWVGAVLTSTSLLIAALSYRRSVLDRERNQAAGVAAWIARRGVHLVPQEGGGHRLIERQALLVSNGSDAPVYEVVIRVPGVSDIRWIEQLPAKETSEQELPDVPQGGATYVVAPGNSVRISYQSEAIVPISPLPELEFRDAVGRIWKRDKDGHLTRLQHRTVVSTAEVELRGDLPASSPREPKT